MKKMSCSIIIGLLICLLGMPGCGDKVVEKKPIKIAINVWPGYAHVFLAQEKGLFKKNNVDVELVLKKSTPESLEMFTNGDADACFDVFANLISLNSKGIRAKVVYITDYSISGDVIIGRPEINSVSELGGKAVAIEGFNTFSHIFVLGSLIKAGVKEAQVKFENIPAHDVLKALEEKRIDAGHTWEPEKSQALKKGYKILAQAGDNPGIITDVLFFSNKAIKERSEEIQAIVKSLFEAQDELTKNKDESLKIMASKMEMTVEEMASGLEGAKITGLQENREMMAKTTSSTPNKPSLFSTGPMIIDFYLKRGQLSKILEIEEFVEPKFLKDLDNK
ncbi:MAG: ABC transporter substrate-binding protein [Candidatus Riflebacteria bacterium]|nr:ABC transporter substrate-binding protein [Candidatus Riflebacteria bacterium]